MIIGVDVESAGAAAIVTSDRGLHVRTAARVARSLPVRTRNDVGVVHDYGDPRLLHERGLVASLEAAWLDTPVAVAGVDHTSRPLELCLGELRHRCRRMGASAGLFALAHLAEARDDAVRWLPSNRPACPASPSQAELRGSYRREPAPRPMPATTFVSDADIPISLAAYERAFEAKTRWEAGKFADSDQLDFPPRYRVADDGALATRLRAGRRSRASAPSTPSVSVHLPVPGLRTPYALAVVELDDVGVRALVKVTGADPDSVDIGDRGLSGSAQSRSAIREFPTTVMRSNRKQKRRQREEGRRRRRRHDAVRRAFRSRHQGSAADGVCRMCCQRRQGHLRRRDLQAAWFGSMGTTDGFPSGILADSLGLPDIPVTRVENSCATGNDADAQCALRHRFRRFRRRARDGRRQDPRDRVQSDACGSGSRWPATWRGITRSAWSRRQDSPCTCAATCTSRRRRVSTWRMIAVKNHRHGVTNPKARLRFEITLEEALAAPTVVTPVRRRSTAPPRATAPPHSSWPPRTSSTGSPTARCGSAASASAWIR